jgi:predicted metalloprotease
VQFLSHVDYAVPDHELQADCGSGRFLAAGRPALSDSDLQPVRRMIATNPSDAAHGTPSQRLAAFDDGYLDETVTHCGQP